MPIKKVFACDQCNKEQPADTAMIPLNWSRLQINTVERLAKDGKNHFKEDIVLQYFCPNCKGMVAATMAAKAELVRKGQP